MAYNSYLYCLNYGQKTVYILAGADCLIKSRHAASRISCAADWETKVQSLVRHINPGHVITPYSLQDSYNQGKESQARGLQRYEIASSDTESLVLRTLIKEQHRRAQSAQEQGLPEPRNYQFHGLMSRSFFASLYAHDRFNNYVASWFKIYLPTFIFGVWQKPPFQSWFFGSKPSFMPIGFLRFSFTRSLPESLFKKILFNNKIFDLCVWVIEPWWPDEAEALHRLQQSYDNFKSAHPALGFSCDVLMAFPLVFFVIGALSLAQSSMILPTSVKSFLEIGILCYSACSGLMSLIMFIDKEKFYSSISGMTWLMEHSKSFERSVSSTAGKMRIYGMGVIAQCVFCYHGVSASFIFEESLLKKYGEWVPYSHWAKGKFLSFYKNALFFALDSHDNLSHCLNYSMNERYQYKPWWAGGLSWVSFLCDTVSERTLALLGYDQGESLLREVVLEQLDPLGEFNDDVALLILPAPLMLGSNGFTKRIQAALSQENNQQNGLDYNLHPCALRFEPGGQTTIEEYQSVNDIGSL